MDICTVFSLPGFRFCLCEFSSAFNESSLLGITPLSIEWSPLTARHEEDGASCDHGLSSVTFTCPAR